MYVHAPPKHVEAIGGGNWKSFLRTAKSPPNAQDISTPVAGLDFFMAQLICW